MHCPAEEKLEDVRVRVTALIGQKLNNMKRQEMWLKYMVKADLEFEELIKRQRALAMR